MKQVGTASRHRSRNSRRHYSVGIWLATLAVFFNALANVILIPIPAQAGTGEQIPICSSDGIRIITVDRDGNADEQAPQGNYCPDCPLCPSYRDLENVGVALISEVPDIITALRLGLANYSATVQSVDLPSPSYSTFLSRGPPLHA